MKPTYGADLSRSWLSEDALQECAWGKSFDRGLDYFQAGAVEGLMLSKGWLIAQVIGSDNYHVRLRVDGYNPQWQCDCPVGQDGLFCKHCVAVGLAWLEQGDDAESEDTGEKLSAYRVPHMRGDEPANRQLRKKGRGTNKPHRSSLSHRQVIKMCRNFRHIESCLCLHRQLRI